MTTTTATANGIHLPPTPPPTSAIDWDAVGFKVHQVNGHAHATWTDGKWSKPEFRQEEILQIHGFAPCLNYGQVSSNPSTLFLVLIDSNALRD